MDDGLNHTVPERPMTRRLHTTGLAGVLTALTLAASVAIASPGPDGAQPPEGPPKDKVARMAEKLKLDEPQTAALEAMRTETKAGREAGRRELEGIRTELEAELAAEEPNEKAIHRLIDQKLELQADLAHNKMDAFLDFRATLSPEQRAEFDTLMKERGARKQKARGRQGPPDKGDQGDALWEQR
jgi:Spy/CpxP family protein refolding chaperone